MFYCLALFIFVCCGAVYLCVLLHQDSRGSSGSFGGGAGGGGGGKVPEMFRVAFFDPDYDTSKQHLVKLVGKQH